MLIEIFLNRTELSLNAANSGNLIYYYRPQRSWAKVIFSQACVCPQGGGLSASVHAGIYIWEQTPLHPGSRCPHPPRPGRPPGSRHPPEIRLQHTVNERPVRILLECVLVYLSFSSWTSFLSDLPIWSHYDVDTSTVSGRNILVFCHEPCSFRSGNIV